MTGPKIHSKYEKFKTNSWKQNPNNSTATQHNFWEQNPKNVQKLTSQISGNRIHTFIGDPWFSYPENAWQCWVSDFVSKKTLIGNSGQSF